MNIQQDMPPPGGFGRISTEKVLPKPLVRQGIWAAIIVGLSINGLYILHDWRKRYRILKLEQAEHYIATYPFFVAEAERKFLRHLRTLREQERELMKDHPGWIVGTLYGEKVYKTIPPGALPPVCVREFIAGRPEGEFSRWVINPDWAL